MNKINKEFSEDFKSLCKSAFACPRSLKLGVQKRKQNRTLKVNLNSGSYSISYYFYGNLVAVYWGRDNTIVLMTQGWGCSPSTKGILNSLCPEGYAFFSKKEKGMTRSPKGEQESDSLVIKPYI